MSSRDNNQNHPIIIKKLSVHRSRKCVFRYKILGGSCINRAYESVTQWVCFGAVMQSKTGLQPIQTGICHTLDSDFESKFGIRVHNWSSNWARVNVQTDVPREPGILVFFWRNYFNIYVKINEIQFLKLSQDLSCMLFVFYLTVTLFHLPNT